MDSELDDEQQDDVQSLNVIEVHLEEPYEVSTPAPEPSNTVVIKGKYYKQTYRPAWESMPDFKGWLRGVQGEPTRAYCLYCQKSLHAHRLSLLKHTCTVRHQKAAQIHTNRMNKMAHQQDMVLRECATNEEEEAGAENDNTTYIAYEMDDGEPEEEEQEETIEEQPKKITISSMPVQFQKFRQQQQQQSQQQQQQQSSPGALTPVKPPISTHVLDTTRGLPVAGLQVSLYKLIDGRWTYINEGFTNPDGRFSKFLERLDFNPGRYKLHYDVDRYFEAKKQDTLYPFIEIVFDCRAPTEHYHVPLLMSPYGYTTYRGC